MVEGDSLAKVPRECLAKVLSSLAPQGYGNACLSCRAIFEASRLRDSLSPELELAKARFHLKQCVARCAPTFENIRLLKFEFFDLLKTCNF